MSHFAVAVVTKDKNKLDEILAPYSENLKVKPYIDETKEQILENAKEHKKRYTKELKKGLNYTGDNYKRRYINAESDEELYKIEIEEFYEGECFDEKGNKLSTYNPDSKWDWYDIGGRYRNWLLTKKTNEDTFEHNSFAEHIGKYEDNREAPKGYKWVNGAKIKDIDFNKIEEINVQPFYTWALVDDIDWYEQGTMGWWAINDATDESTDNFAKQFKKYIKSPENQNKYMIIVDCHI